VRVCIAIPQTLEYPIEAIIEGVSAIGYEPVAARRAAEADILVTWSPWKRSIREALQKQFTESGRRVVVVENGWLSPISGRPFYQLALDGWNGTGTFEAGAPDRWHGWGIALKPWQTRVGYSLVCGQRGHPFDDRSCPPDWHLTLAPKSGAPSILRRARDSVRPLLADLAGASECHVWTSNAASWAVIEGVPVVQHGPNLMVAALAKKAGDSPYYLGPREPELERLAWAQWSELELASGVPFARLLRS
jgi:hypothetical protein